jgi:hypothetical protein
MRSNDRDLDVAGNPRIMILTMSTLVATGTATSNAVDSRIGFATEGGGDWPAWDRFITLDGRKAYHIGNICGTCAFFFERLDGANQKISVTELAKRFRSGITDLDSEIVHTAAAALPPGDYCTMLVNGVPRRILPAEQGDYFREEQVALWGVDRFWGLPHYTKTEYYRTEPVPMTDARMLFEFIIPMVPKCFLWADAVSSYKTALSNGETPTALAVSVLDVKRPVDWEGEPAVNAHWCLSHYLLDGHHKTLAASELGLPISILSFLAIEKGVSSREEIKEAIQNLIAK